MCYIVPRNTNEERRISVGALVCIDLLIVFSKQNIT